jgi:hypothetical protein
MFAVDSVLSVQICPRGAWDMLASGDAHLKTQLLSLLAFQPAATAIEYAWDAATRLAAGQDERFRPQARIIANWPITIISFHPRDFAAFQDSSDWHDMCGHHRYYGESA